MSKQIGDEGEDRACIALEASGYQIQERNFRTRSGEVDIIALDGKVVCFVEVKMRKYDAFGGGIAAITKEKLRKLLLTAKQYLMEKGWSGRDYRIDAVIIEGNNEPEIIQNIFTEGL